MNRKQKHTNLPMIAMNKLQQAGWYEYNKYYIDMDVPYPALFVEVYSSRRKNLRSTAQRMDFVHSSEDRNRNVTFRRPGCRHAHDAFHRFFPDARWSMAGLWKILAQILIKTFYRTGIITLALDDTLFHHSGKKVNGAGRWRDAVRSTSTKNFSAWGLNLVVLTLQIQPPSGGEPLGLPINMRLHRKKQASLIELAEQMVKEVVEWHPKRLFRVVADGFYASLAGKKLFNTTIISRMQCNAEVYDLPVKPKKKGRPRKKGKRVLCPQKLAKSVRHWQKVEVCERGKSRTRLVYSKVLLWYRVSQQPILLVIGSWR